MKVCALITLACLTLASPAYARQDAAQVSNAEMTRLYGEDQADRTGDVDWNKVSPRDEQRRAQTRHLLETGALHTSADFNHAAFIFQHGDTADDYLLAHTLAMVAVGKGDRSSLWIASATLDRYLVTVKQPQVYGTQFMRRNGKPYGQEPYNRDLVSDALRAELGVPSLKEQALRVQQLQSLERQAAKP
jgi:hypothetical protein